MPCVRSSCNELNGDTQSDIAPAAIVIYNFRVPPLMLRNLLNNWGKTQGTSAEGLPRCLHVFCLFLLYFQNV